MAFDVGAGLATMGQGLAQTAQIGLVESMRNDAEMERLKLANDLAMQRQGQQQEFEKGQQGRLFEQQSKENKLTRENQLETTKIHAGATMAAAGAAAAAHRYSADIGLQTARENNARAIEVAKLYVQGRSDVEDKKLQAANAKFAQVLLPPDALQQQVDQYIQTGKMGVGGMNSSATKNQVLAAVPEELKKRGISSEDMVAGWSTQEAQKKNLDNQVKLGGQLANFANTMHKNIEGAQELIEKGALGPTESPVLDRWIQAGRRAIQGDAQVTALDYQLKQIATEAAKLTTNQLGISGLPEGARTEYEKIIGSMNNREQLELLFKQFSADAVNRLTATQNIVEQAQKSLKTNKIENFNNVPVQPAATPGNPKGVDSIPMTKDGLPDVASMKPGRPYYLGPGHGPPAGMYHVDPITGRVMPGEE